MIFGKDVRVILRDQALQSYLWLKERNEKEYQSILRSIERIKEILKTNPFYGDSIPKELIPKDFKDFEIDNLYRAELSNYWRMLYTIKTNRIEIFVFILTITDHPTYNKMFGYK